MDRANGLTVNSSRFNLAGGMRIPEPRIRDKPHCAVAHKEYDDEMNTLLAQIAVSTNSIVWAIVMLIVAGLILWILNWAIAAIGLPEPMAKVAKVVLILFAALIAINAILTLVGHPLVRLQ